MIIIEAPVLTVVWSISNPPVITVTSILSLIIIPAELEAVGATIAGVVYVAGFVPPVVLVFHVDKSLQLPTDFAI